MYGLGLVHHCAAWLVVMLMDWGYGLMDDSIAVYECDLYRL